MNKIEFIAQDSAGSCGATALAMVLGQFGIKEEPQKIAKLLTKIGTNGQPCIRTHELANYARGLGFSTMVAQFSEPWKALIRSHEAGFGVIINHRLDREKTTGHFSVLTEISQPDDAIFLHDPQRGPDQRKTREELLELWSPLSPGSQIAGMVGIAIAPRPIGGVPSYCKACSRQYEDKVPLKCYRCSIVLEPLPGFVLGCLANDCSAKLWRRIYCPNCDQTWSGKDHARKTEPLIEPVDTSIADLTEESLSAATIEQLPVTEEVNETSNEVPEEDLSGLKLAEALNSIPLPDWGAIAALAESQKQTLIELAESSEIAEDLRDRARQWESAADEVRREASQLEAYRNSLSAEIQSAAESAKTDSVKLKEMVDFKPEVDEKKNEAEPETPLAEAKAKPALPTGPELVARLLSMAKRKS